MAKIDTDKLVEKIHNVCGDTSHSKEESLEAYEDVVEAAETMVNALRAEID